MRRPDRRLSAEEADLWARVAATVKPLRGRRVAPVRAEKAVDTVPAIPAHVPPPPPLKKRVAGRVPPPPPPRPADPPARPLDRHGLDAGWERKLSRGLVQPDFTLDLHGHTLDAAHARLDHGIAQALAHGARVLLLVTGRARPDDQGGRGERRGAIRAKFMDWLAAGSHASRIAAVRSAHPRHGGAGAVYIVLKRPR